jgi:predicted phage baseplate assembly protein
MSHESPELDRRTVTDIAQQVQGLTRVYAPQWKEFDPATGQATGVSAALIGIFARFSELIIQRLNQAPQKNFLAFLDLLGASLLPPQPARVPLTFSLAAGSPAEGLVLAGTQVAAPPTEKEKAPVIFETERELVVTAAQLASLYVRDPEQDQQAVRSALTTEAAEHGAPLFRGDESIEHTLYVGHRLLLGFSHIINTTLQVTLEAGLSDRRQVSWELWDGLQWRSTAPTPEDVKNLAASGNISFGATAPVPESSVNGVQSRWLRARLLTPITKESQPRLNMVRAEDLPKVRALRLSVGLRRDPPEGLTPEVAFTDAAPLDLSKDFFPFGERPRQHSALYLASAEAFSKDSAGGLAPRGATVQLEIVVANSHLSSAETRVWPSTDLQLDWECWNGDAWQRVGTSNAPAWLTVMEVEPPPEVVNEPTVVIEGRAQRGAALSARVQQAQATATAPRAVKVGEDGRFALQASASVGLNIVTFTAIRQGSDILTWAVFFREDGATQQNITLNVPVPSQPLNAPVTSLTVGVAGGGASQVTTVRITQGRTGVAASAPKNSPMGVQLFEGRNDFLVEGLSGAGVTLAAKTVTIFRPGAAPPADPATGLVDGTHALSQSGTVTLTLPGRVAAKAVSGVENFWLRARIVRGDYGREASYRLKNPAAPEEGFTLVLESFRPPILSSVRLGYQQTLTGAPEVLLAYNNSAFEPAAPGLVFEPFRPAPEDRPTFYVGFTLPANKSVFPNRRITLYAHVEGLKYGERAAPVSPDQSKQFGAPALTARHKFFVTNDSAAAATFTFGILGTRWQPAPAAPLPLEVPAGESKEVEVAVGVPSNAPPGTGDRGFLRVKTSAAPGSEHTVSFITFAGEENSTGEQLRLAWEYWNGRGWAALTVREDTENFTRPGLIEFLAPPDFSAHAEFGLPPRHWLRVRREAGQYTVAPRLRRLLLNTTLAAQTVTIRNETLGSSDGNAGQRFRSTQAPVLFGQRLEVREPEMPSAAELEVITATEGDDAVTLISDAAGRPREVWVRWHEVPDFYGSSPRDRHYVLDRLTGETRTGDGLNGLIPPPGTGNVRLALYQTGGGSAGNKPAGTIVQLKTTVPYVDKVTNEVDAAGGADGETLESLVERAPRSIRHGGRAVTLEDYEDLAMLASPAVARAKCIPLRNLIDDPLDERPTVRGEVSVIVVPRSREAKPLPTLELLNRVQDYLEARSVPTARVSVVGPLYIRVDVTVEIALASMEGASTVEQATQERLASFLHPLTGGLDGAGWDFGRRVHQSDLYALIENVPGVDHIRSLDVEETEEQPGVRPTGRFLVYSGTHTVGLVF